MFGSKPDVDVVRSVHATLTPQSGKSDYLQDAWRVLDRAPPSRLIYYWIEATPGFPLKILFIPFDSNSNSGVEHAIPLDSEAVR